MPAPSRTIAERHYRARPMSNLSDEELDALRRLADSSVLFSPDLADALDVLGELATREEADRHEVNRP